MREDIDITSPSLTVRFNEKVISEAEVRKLLDTMKPLTRVHAAKDYAFSVDLPVVITIIVVIASSYFAKGFFTRVGERLGEEVGSDAVRVYKKFKEGVARLAVRKAKGKKGTLRFELLYDSSPFEVHARVESSNGRDFERAFDGLEDLMAVAGRDASEVKESKREEVVRAHYRYSPGRREWVMIYAVTRSGRILSIEGRQTPISRRSS